MALLDLIFPGFSIFATAVQKFAGIDLNLYIPLVLLFGALTLVWNYSSQYFWESLEAHFMSTVDIRTDDEIYNILMTWVANQRFAQGARRFVVNTNLNSRSWYLWRWDDDEGEESADLTGQTSEAQKKKALSYTPSFGSHYFFYRGRVLLFRRSAKENNSFMAVSEREEISISCFGRNPYILKELLLEARSLYIEKDQQKTLIYRGTVRSGSTEPTWQRCMARSSRPFSTVILNKQKKMDIIDDVTDYLAPATQRWYSNRGIPYRRGYLLYGPPGTGKSSLSLALAGFFKMRIYIVSLSSITANEENLASLFAELPRRCVVLLEDIDTAGLTHTREDDKKDAPVVAAEPLEPTQVTAGNGNTNSNNNQPTGRLSLSGLLNILDGVASQEGRVLIMTTNHLEKLDKALIRPGRVDMIVEFGLADTEMITAIYNAIFAHLEGDDGVVPEDLALDPDARQALADAKEKKRLTDEARVNAMAVEFASKIPAHEFSPAELQGHLMRHKRDPQAAIDKAEEFVEQTRKDRKEKEIKDAEDKRKAEEKKKADDEKKKADDEKKKKDEEEEKAKKEKKERKKKAKEAERKKKRSKDSDTDSSSDASSSESEADEKKKQKKIKDKKTKDDEGKKDLPKAETPEDKAEVVEVKVKEKESGHERKDSGYATPASVEA
jgi:chaperone BCS1